MAPLTGTHRPLPRSGDAHACLCEEFLSLASHELMTPVTSLALGAEVVKREIARQPGVSGRVAAALDIFDRQIGRLTLLFDELLQATELEAYPPELTLEDVDLIQLVHRVVGRLAAQLPEAARTVRVDAGPALAGRWDRARIERVVLHLVKNALTFGEGKPITIEVRPTPDARAGARLVVRDQGLGIAREDQARIFERFQRAVPASHFGGLGLGLYIARAVVRAHGGSIAVESEPGQGAAFTVDLPLAPGGGAAAPGAGQTPRARPLAPRGRALARRSRARRRLRSAARRPARSRAARSPAP
jgi:signal transduction histidine kinase